MFVFAKVIPKTLLIPFFPDTVYRPRVISYYNYMYVLKVHFSK